MKVVGIVAEFNPMHNGHAHLISTARRMGAVCIVATISGNFVQRGDTAIISKHARAKIALSCGVDLCLELPTVYCMSTAQNFAYGSIYALCAAGVDTIVFGSECGDAEMLKNIANVLTTDEFKTALSNRLADGCSFPAARQMAISDVMGEEYGKILENPNDNLGIEYIGAAKIIGADVDFVAVNRIGADHDSDIANPICPSASFLRNIIRDGDIKQIEKYMPTDGANILKAEMDLGRVSDITRLTTAILAKLRSMSPASYKTLPDISEGIENRLMKAAASAGTLNELYELTKTKRYTLARIRRLALSAFLGMTDDFFLSPPPYIRILGHNAVGLQQVKDGFKNEKAYSRVGQIVADKDPRSARMLQIEALASDLYELSLQNPGKCGKEYSEKLIVM